MAWIENHRRSGVLKYRVRWRTPDGRDRSKVFSLKREAERFRATIEVAKSEGRYVDPAAGRILLRDYAEHWRQNQVQHRPATRARVESNLRKHLYPALGNRPLSSILRSDVQAWVTGMASQLAPSSVEIAYAYLATIMKVAVADRLVSSTPCAGIKMPQLDRPPVVPLAIHQIEQIAAGVPDRYRGMVLAMATTGLRFGEAAGLTVDRVDFLRRSLRVDRQWGDQGFGPPKTKTSYRDIPLATMTVEALAGQLATYPALEPDGFVFHTGRVPLIRKRFREIWWRAVRPLQLEATPHDLRHFYASVLIRQGADVKQVQERLGHKSAQTTLDTYGHLWPDSDDRTRAAIDTAFDRVLSDAIDE